MGEESQPRGSSHAQSHRIRGPAVFDDNSSSRTHRSPQHHSTRTESDTGQGEHGTYPGTGGLSDVDSDTVRAAAAIWKRERHASHGNVKALGERRRQRHLQQLLRKCVVWGQSKGLPSFSGPFQPSEMR